MRKSLAIFLLGAVTICALPTANLMADIIPPIGLAPGSEYQLIFVTADTTNAESTAISTYNTFVTDEAALNSSLPSATWDAVGTTATVNANVNAPNDFVDGSYLPVYNTQGIEVSGAAGLYSGDPLSSPIQYNQFALPGGNGAVWTGSGPTGSTDFRNLGGGAVESGGATLSGSDWMALESHPSSFPLPLYALSAPLFATPEPATITLLGSALSLLAGFHLLKRRRMALAIRAGS